MHVMNAGGVVRKIDSWGTKTLPQKIKRNGPLHSVGEWVELYCPFLSCLTVCTATGLCTLMRVQGHYGRLTVSCAVTPVFYDGQC